MLFLIYEAIPKHTLIDASLHVVLEASLDILEIYGKWTMIGGRDIS